MPTRQMVEWEGPRGADRNTQVGKEWPLQHYSLAGRAPSQAPPCPHTLLQPFFGHTKTKPQSRPFWTPPHIFGSPFPVSAVVQHFCMGWWLTHITRTSGTHCLCPVTQSRTQASHGFCVSLPYLKPVNETQWNWSSTSFYAPRNRNSKLSWSSQARWWTTKLMCCCRRLLLPNWAEGPCTKSGGKT